MANLNRVLLIGNLTRDPEVRYTPKGTAVADIGMAINRVIGGSDDTERREEVTYVDVTLWGRQAEIAQQYLTKGRGVFIEGRLQLDSWDDKQTGQKRSKLKVVAENMQLLGGRSGPGGEGEPSAGGERANPPRRGSASGGGAPAPRPARDPDLDAEPDDIPF
ncbi:MAG TPA: single-stranded DNA-binding protein [Chthoniobacterales bacterium]